MPVDITTRSIGGHRHMISGAMRTPKMQNPAEPKPSGAKLFAQFLHIDLAPYAVPAYKQGVRQFRLTAKEKAMSYETASLILQALAVIVALASLITNLR